MRIRWRRIVLEKTHSDDVEMEGLKIIKLSKPFCYHACRRIAEIVFNATIAKLPNRVFRSLRAASMRRLGASIGNGVKISQGVKVLGAHRLVIEEDVAVANSVLLDARGGLTIRKGALIGFESIILTYTHAWPDPKRPVQVQGVVSKEVTIGSNAWLGMRVLILPGVTVGESSVIGAGSVVTRPVPEMSVAAGNPCSVRRTREDRS